MQRNENHGAREGRLLMRRGVRKRVRTLFSAQDGITCTTPLAMQRRSLEVRLRSTVRRLARLVSARTLGSDPADPLALRASFSCRQTSVAWQLCGDIHVYFSIRAIVVFVSSKGSERPCAPRRSRSALSARRALRTRRERQARRQRRCRCQLSLWSQLATSTSSSCRLSRVSWTATSSCRRILHRDLEEVLTRSLHISRCTDQGRSGTCPTCSSSTALDQHRVHPMQWRQLQSAHEQVFFSVETKVTETADEADVRRQSRRRFGWLGVGTTSKLLLSMRTKLKHVRQKTCRKSTRKEVRA